MSGCNALLRRAIAAAVVAGLAGAGAAQPGAAYEARFDAAWRLVEERYWRLEDRGVDWSAVRETYLPQAVEATSEDAFYDVLVAMYEELGDDHSVFVPPAEAAAIRDAYGDLPCLGLFGQGGAAERTDGNVTYSLLPGGVGYVRLPDLATPGVAGSVRRAVRSLVDRRATALVLDVRGNPGGRLIEMMQVAGVFTDGFLWRALTDWMLPIPYPAIGATETELPLAVLIDGNVHSAAEGLVGALQQRKRAVVVGERSAGNVEAVLPFCLPDGSQAWIATGVLAPIGGPTWEGRGVVPDIATDADGALERALRLLRPR